jgi:hypothetical protein
LIYNDTISDVGGGSYRILGEEKGEWRMEAEEEQKARSGD